MGRAAIVTIAVLALATAPVWAEQTGTFGWEDGTTTALGMYTSGNDNLVLENSTEQANGGMHSLKMIENPAADTPQAFIWWITGLAEGDVITASFWVYDTTEGGNPSGRIWAHYTDNVDITSYEGSASGNSDYSAGTGWSQLTHTWTVDDDPTHVGLVVEARIYSVADGDVIYIDDAGITVSSDTATVLAADGTEVPVELMSFSVE